MNPCAPGGLSMSATAHMPAATALCVLAAMLAGSLAAADGWNTERLDAALNLTEDFRGGESEHDWAFALDSILAKDRGQTRWEFVLDSDYHRSLTGQTELNRLKTWSRYMLQKRPREQWNPLIAISTEGDHSFESVHTLIALGARKHWSQGFIELTAGASKDVKTAADWVGDVGALVQHQRRWGRFTWTLTPQGNLGVLGEVRLRPDRLLYTLDSGLVYDVGRHLGIAYRLQLSNTLGEDQRHQFLGLSYSK